MFDCVAVLKRHSDFFSFYHWGGCTFIAQDSIPIPTVAHLITHLYVPKESEFTPVFHQQTSDQIRPTLPSEPQPPRRTLLKVLTWKVWR